MLDRQRNPLIRQSMSDVVTKWPNMSIIRNSFPDIFPLSVYTVQHLIDHSNDQLTFAMIVNERAYFMEMDSETRQESKQGGFHDRKPVGNIILRAHPDYSGKQPQSDMRQ